MDNTTKEKIKAWTPLGRPVIEISDAEHPEQKSFDAFARLWQEISTAISWPCKANAGNDGTVRHSRERCAYLIFNYALAGQPEADSC